MNRPQQALAGALAGALSVLSLHPATRPFLLRPLMPPEPVQSLAKLPAGDAQQALFLYEKAFGPGERTTDDLLSIAEAAQKLAATDPKNAVWPTLEAWAQDGLDNQEAAELAWHKASLRPHWDDVRPALVRDDDVAWDRYRQEAALGSGFAQAYDAYVQRLALGEPGEDLARWEAVQIGVTGWRSSTRFASQLAFRNCLADAVWAGQDGRTPLLGEAKRQLSPERYRLLGAVLADTSKAGARQERLGLEALAASRLAGGAVLAGAAGAVLFALGSLMAASGRVRAPFCLPWCAVAGAAVAVGVFATTRLAFPALWSAVVFGGFAVVRERVWRGELADYGRAFSAVLGVLGLLFVVSVATAVAASDPTAQGLADGTGLGGDAATVATTMRAMALFWLSLVLVGAQALAFVRRRDPAVLAARALCRFGLVAMVTGLVLGVVFTPVGLAWDARLRHTMETGSMLD